MPIGSLLTLLNIFILESLLSVDNAAVLAMMVKVLPVKQQPKALKYGIFGGYFFRGIALLCASWLMKILWLKIAGGFYLIFLTMKHFKSPKDEVEVSADWSKNKIAKFWATVLLVEIMDMAFSIDNIFAAVAMTSNITLILCGVFIGMLAMRFVAIWFIVMIKKYPSLENSAFIVIACLGLKLIINGIADFFPGGIGYNIPAHLTDVLFSALMMGIFFFSLLLKPKNNITF